LNNITNRQLFIQYMKTSKSKIPNTYTYKLIKDEDMVKLRTVKKVGRPRKSKVCSKAVAD